MLVNIKGLKKWVIFLPLRGFEYLQMFFVELLLICVAHLMTIHRKCPYLYPNESLKSPQATFNETRVPKLICDVLVFILLSRYLFHRW